MDAVALLLRCCELSRLLVVGARRSGRRDVGCHDVPAIALVPQLLRDEILRRRGVTASSQHQDGHRPAHTRSTARDRSPIVNLQASVAPRRTSPAAVRPSPHGCSPRTPAATGATGRPPANPAQHHPAPTTAPAGSGRPDPERHNARSGTRTGRLVLGMLSSTTGLPKGGSIGHGGHGNGTVRPATPGGTHDAGDTAPNPWIRPPTVGQPTRSRGLWVGAFWDVDGASGRRCLRLPARIGR